MTDTPKLRDALKILDKSVTDALAYFDQLNPADLQSTLKAFALLGENIDTLETLAKALNKTYDKLNYEVLPNAFETIGFDSVKTAGKNFILSTRINASIPEDKRDGAHQWIIDVAKTPELIVQRINPKSLSSFIKTYFEANAQWPPEDLIKVHKQNYIQVRKA